MAAVVGKGLASFGEVGVNHPNAARLAAFGHGKLGEAGAEAVAAHLAGCAACQEYLDNLADDALLALVRSLFVPDPCPASSSATPQ
jgi:hypothetical protein